ncbi:virulence factor Mce-like protein [Mycolicibacterium sp. BK556]|uniref:MCE family protein n=1 Tax=unclassified Mycolicibacterium TaxID=2636767 RepID=UPI00161592E9|nr:MULTISPECIES: MCE family protein [unclassified Mycolicibacterium]MBB3606882.1 virulence factor Mce-like protein [Mycolicibacterium sp. BK556]MBB3636452.1 virulence factor Mce-like protein [Mycolicibacterium sp. BK607]MBB3754461.1 virulence factor Mce-like protein [Mycolicibacterium sp. BK634]
MSGRSRIVAATAAVLVALAAASATILVRHTYYPATKITAFFTAASAIYAGDEVRVSGVKVGQIDSIEPDGTQVKIVLSVDPGVSVPADASAVIVAQNLVAARYLQLTPAYRDSGPTMPSGAVIPIERTAVPVEWDDVKTQLMRLSTDLGPNSATARPALARLIDDTADAMGGNGVKLRQMLAQLSSVARIFADGSANVVDIITGLQKLVTALRDSSGAIVDFEQRLAAVTGTLSDHTGDLDAALHDLTTAVSDTQRFVGESRELTVEQIQRLTDVIRNLADNRKSLEQLLHVAPNAFANYYNVYNPDTGDNIGSIVFNDFANPIQFICGQIGAIENATAPETGKLCAQYLGPALRLLSFNLVPFPMSPYLMKAPSPENLLYSDPALAPGGAP